MQTDPFWPNKLQNVTLFVDGPEDVSEAGSSPNLISFPWLLKSYMSYLNL